MMYNQDVGRKKDGGKRKGVYHKRVGIPFGLWHKNEDRTLKELSNVRIE
jgi:hypothetical protein